MKTVLSFVFCCLLFALNAQQEQVEIPQHQYKFSQQIKDELNNEELRTHRAGWHYSYIGQYQKAIATIKREPRHGLDTLTDALLEHFKSFEAREATSYLLEAAKNEQIVIVNETHHHPQHRIFTRQLLKGLYAEGFRYFGLECLNTNFFNPDAENLLLDSTLNERGYPFNSHLSGTYVQEPQMSNLIREAISIGFEIFAYERNRKGNREEIQAEHVMRVLKKHPEARILLLCGYDHVLEAPVEDSYKRKWMACQLKDMSGINPFTVEQAILSEAYPGLEAPLYNHIDAKIPSVFQNAKGEVFNGFKGNELFDVLVYHPPSKYQNNRPKWLINYGENRLVTVPKDKITINYPCLVKAYNPAEQPEAAPIDVIEVKDQTDETALVLPPGKYRLELVNPEEAKQVIEITVE